MRYLFDTDTVSELYSTDSEIFTKLTSRLTSLQDKDDICISVLTCYELEFWYANAPENLKPKIRVKIDTIFDIFTLLPLKFEHAKLFGKIKKWFVDTWNVSKQPAKRHVVDIMLAVTAIQEWCILVSSDSIYTAIGKLYSDLQHENWMEH